MFRQDSWHEAWHRLGAVAPAELLPELVERYSESHRFYHTIQHIEECLAAFRSALPLADRPAEIEIAIWFHDSIYDPRASDNELRSARWAEAALAKTGVEVEAVGRVCDLVLATRHDKISEHDDGRLIADVDLWILAAPTARFAEYEQQVRREYEWVPETAFREGRARVLRTFYSRPSIYSTQWFRNHYEEQARRNIARSLDDLA